jgi:hypothetical protein
MPARPCIFAAPGDATLEALAGGSAWRAGPDRATARAAMTCTPRQCFTTVRHDHRIKLSDTNEKWGSYRYEPHFKFWLPDLDSNQGPAD